MTIFLKAFENLLMLSDYHETHFPTIETREARRRRILFVIGLRSVTKRRTHSFMTPHVGNLMHIHSIQFGSSLLNLPMSTDISFSPANSESHVKHLNAVVDS